MLDEQKAGDVESDDARDEVKKIMKQISKISDDEREAAKVLVEQALLDKSLIK